MTHEEFLEKYVGGLLPKPKRDGSKPFAYSNVNAADVPASADHRTTGGVNAVKNQEQCGSCWAFSAVASMEFAYWKSSGTLKSLSE